MTNYAYIGGLEGQQAPSFDPNNLPLLFIGIIRSIIPYTGGKHGLVKILNPLIEWTAREYGLDTFITATGGACRCLLNLDPERLIFKRRVYSDVDYSLSCLFHVLGDEFLTEKLIQRLSSMDCTDYVFRVAQAARIADDELAKLGKFDEASDYVSAAANMYFLAKMSYAANLKSIDWGKVQKPEKFYEDVLNLHQFNAILKDVTVFRKDCRQLIREIESKQDGYDPERTIILCDVPYDVNECLTKKHYDYTWNEQDHIIFRELVKESQAYLIICGYESGLYDELIKRYPNRWRKVFLKFKHVSQTGKSVFKDEWIYINFELSPEMYAFIENERS